MFDPREKVALFIDGANLYATSKALGFDIDYRKMLKYFQSQERGYLLRAHYYTALVEDQEFSSIRPLVDWLDYNGFRVVTKPAKEFTDAMGRRKIKGNMDIELAVDAMQLAEIARIAMIFVRSQGGVSHSPDEYTSPEDAAAGTEVLARTLYRLGYGS